MDTEQACKSKPPARGLSRKKEPNTGNCLALDVAGGWLPNLINTGDVHSRTTPMTHYSVQFPLLHIKVAVPPMPKKIQNDQLIGLCTTRPLLYFAILVEVQGLFAFLSLPATLRPQKTHMHMDRHTHIYLYVYTQNAHMHACTHAPARSVTIHLPTNWQARCNSKTKRYGASSFTI